MYCIIVFDGGGRAIQSPHAFGFNCKWMQNSHPLADYLDMFFGIICIVKEFRTIQL
jgi:hypothetical protein